MRSTLAGRVARLAMRHRRAILCGSLALSVLSLLSLTQMRLDVDVLSTLPSGEAAFDEFTDYLEAFGGTQTLLVLVSAAPADSHPAGPSHVERADSRRADGSQSARDAAPTREGAEENPAPAGAAETHALTRAVDLLAARYRELPQVKSVTAGVDFAAMATYLDPLHAPALVPAERFAELRARLEPDAIAAALARAKAALSLPLGPEATERIRRDPLGLSAVAGEAIRDRYADPFAGRADSHFLSPDGTAALIIVSPTGSPFDAHFTAGLFERLRAIEAEARASDPELAAMRIRHAGAYAHADEDARLIEGDVARYILLTLICVIATFQIGYRNALMLPLIGYLLIAGSLLAFAASVLIYHQLNALSISFTAIFFGLAIDSGIHFYSRLLIERRTAPSLEEAVVRTCDGIGAANVVASTTTAAAFAVVAFSAIAAIRQIGVLTAIGMLVNVVHTFVLLPALTAAAAGALERRPARAQDAPWLAAVAAASARHRYPVVACAAVAALAWVVASPTIPVDAEIVHLRPEGVESTITEDAIEAHFGALVPRGVVVVEGADLETALRREERVVAWLEAHRAGANGGGERAGAEGDDGRPAGNDEGRASADGRGTQRTGRDALIAGYQALSTFLPSRATEDARRAAFAALPLARARQTLEQELARQGFRVAAFADAERALAPSDAALPRPRLDDDGETSALAPFLRRHVGKAALRGVIVDGARRASGRSHDGPDAAVMLAVPFQPAAGVSLAAVRDRLRAEIDPPPIVTGRELMQDALGTVIARELIAFTLITIALNLLIVLAQVRSLRLALVVMAPTAVIVGALIGGMHLAHVAFTPLNLIVLPLTLGIGVDNCVYLTERFREGRRIGEAVRLAGRAITLTTLTTMAGFGFLSVSRYPGLAGLGWLAAIAIGLTFVAAIVLLPAFLALGGRTLADASPGREPAASDRRIAIPRPSPASGAGSRDA